MEDALALGRGTHHALKKEEVLILVVMEDALARICLRARTKIAKGS